MDNTYLIADTPQVNMVNNIDSSVTEVNVRGLWNDELRSVAAHQMRACMAEIPRAVIVELARLSDSTGASAPTWRTAHRHAAAQPSGADVILAAVPAPLLNRLRHHTGEATIRTAETMAIARTLIRRPDWTRRRLIALPPDDTSPARARTLVGDACLAWNLPQLLYPALLIVSELTDNAVAHADTEVTVAVSLRGSMLHLAVHDHHHDLPHLIEAAPGRARRQIEQRGAGLRLIRHLSTAWGAMPCRVGKVVWATLDRLDPGIWRADATSATAEADTAVLP